MPRPVGSLGALVNAQPADYSTSYCHGGAIRSTELWLAASCGLKIRESFASCYPSIHFPTEFLLMCFNILGEHAVLFHPAEFRLPGLFSGLLQLLCFRPCSESKLEKNWARRTVSERETDSLICEVRVKAKAIRDWLHVKVGLGVGRESRSWRSRGNLVSLETEANLWMDSNDECGWVGGQERKFWGVRKVQNPLLSRCFPS